MGSAATNPRVAVVMALYHPDQTRLEKQIASICNQSRTDLSLHLFADGPMPQLAQIRDIAGNHQDATLECFEENRGPAPTFLAGLEWALDKCPDAEYFAFADQDDVWLEDKLARSTDTLIRSGAAAVHTDASLTDDRGTEIASSMFEYESRDRSPTLKRLFFRNNATGMTMVLTRDLARQVIELRDMRPNTWLHDHFAAFLAKAGDGLEFLLEPTVQYVQHGGNVVGANAVSGSVGASGNFAKSGSASDLVLRQGAALVSSLLDSEKTNPRIRAELEELKHLLYGRGIVDLLRTLPELLRISQRARPLMARLVWCKLTSHRWQPDTISS